jgi:hypothetical protein
MKAHGLFLALALGAWTLGTQAWEEQRVLEFVMVHNQVVRAHHTVTDEFTPPSGVMARMKEYTSTYGRTGVGGTDFLSGEDQPFVLQAGIQISIPLAGTKERREHALKMVEETRAMDEIRGKVLADIASLRHHEADLEAAETRLKFYESKSEWLQKRVKEGFSDSAELWDIGQKLHEERATAERLRTLAASARYQLASYAGEQWQVLLGYLEGKGELGPRP